MTVSASTTPRLREGYATAEVDAFRKELPLALAQAIGLLAETSMTVPEYRTELTARARTLLSEGRGGDYPLSLAAAIETTLAHLSPQDGAAAELLHLAAVLAPDPIPWSWLRDAPDDVLPDPLAAVATQPLALRRSLSRLADLGLAQITDRTVQVHRLTQAVLRDSRPPEQLAADRDRAVRLVAAAQPDNEGRDPASWPAWAVLLPHLLALDPGTAPPLLRPLACHTLRYLLMRGEYHTVLPLAEAWHTQWQAVDGYEDLDVLRAANQRSTVYRFLGRYQEAHDQTGPPWMSGRGGRPRPP
jgi:hypothetical protein